MKKILLGCGCLIALIAASVTSCFIYLGVKIKNSVTNYQAAVVRFTELENQFPYTEPIPAEDGTFEEIAPEDFERYLFVRKGVAEGIEAIPMIGDLLVMSDSTQTTAPNPPGVGALWTLATKGYESINQITAVFEEADMSVAEFQFISSRVVVASKEAADSGDEDYAALWDRLPAAADAFDQQMAEIRVQMDEVAAQMEQSGQAADFGPLAFDTSEATNISDTLRDITFPAPPRADVERVTESKEDILQPSFMLILEVMFNIDTILKQSKQSIEQVQTRSASEEIPVLLPEGGDATTLEP